MRTYFGDLDTHIGNMRGKSDGMWPALQPWHLNPPESGELSEPVDTFLFDALLPEHGARSADWLFQTSENEAAHPHSRTQSEGKEPVCLFLATHLPVCVDRSHRGRYGLFRAKATRAQRCNVRRSAVIVPASLEKVPPE